MRYIQYCFVFLCFFLFIPHVVSAQLIFTEISYNPAGTDTGREWIEVHNTGLVPVDVSVYKLLESGVNHKITAHTGSGMIDVGGYAVIADDPIKFLNDFPNISNVFDSAFSLNNTGEELKLIDEGGLVADSVSYMSEWGGADTGNSLQKNGNSFIPAVPTPGLVNKTEPADETVESDADDDDTPSSSSAGSGSSHEEQVDISTYKPKQKLSISAGRQRYASIFSPIEFILVHNQDASANVRARWSMGNGDSVRGKKISYSFDRPGEYVVVVNARFDDVVAVSRTKVVVSVPDIQVSTRDSGKDVDLLFKNNGTNEVNVGGYTIQTGKRSFVFAPDTIIGGGDTIVLSETTTHLVHNQDTVVYYPNNDRLFPSN